MNQALPAHQLPGDLDLDDLDVQQPPGSPTDSDYYSSFEEESPSEDEEEDTVPVSTSDDWLEFDLSAESAQSLSFLSDSDFQAVLRSFAEFTGQQFNNPLLNLREIQVALTNHLAFLLWRKAVMSEVRQRPFHSKHLNSSQIVNASYMSYATVEPEQLDELLNGKWREDSALMQFNRQRFRNLADATTVPQLVLATFKTCFIRKRHAERSPSSDEYSKKTRQNMG